MTAASDVIGIEDVFEARIASCGSVSSARRKIASLTSASSTTASMRRSAGTSSLDRGDPREHLVGSGSALLGELAEAPLHRRERPLDRTRDLVVERDAPPRRRHDLRDAAAHLAGTDDEDVLEAHRVVRLTSAR